jgi:SAM-dependent MidA family methyltransferase
MSMYIKMPELDKDLIAHSEQLRHLICQEIDKLGPMSFARYMEMALYEPGLGYYRCGAQKFGAAGDFITAPELSPLFAGCLAKRCAGLLGQGYQDIFEIGAGSGVLAVEVMKSLERFEQLPRCYYILELSSELIQRQKALVEQHIPHLYARFKWLDAWPQDFNGVIIANELFDAMPVHRFIIKEGIKEYFVTHTNGELQWHIDNPSTTELTRQLENYQIDFAEGYSSEINLMISAWIKSLCESINKAHMIFIDYGYKREIYYHPERSMGTLMCHLQHRAHDDPLLYPGVQDITSHVDFTLIAESAVDSGCEVASLNTQSQYLLEQGITDLLSQETDMTRQALLAQQVKQLLMPGQMGEAFKVLELVKQ